MFRVLDRLRETAREAQFRYVTRGGVAGIKRYRCWTATKFARPSAPTCLWRQVLTESIDSIFGVYRFLTPLTGRTPS